MPSSIRDVFPRLYHPLLPAFFDQPAPDEQKATCSNCAMLKPEGAPPADEVVYFRPDIKCCTFHPKLPSYLVGAILRDDRPDMAEGKRRIQEKIARRIGVTPRWISAPRKYSLLFTASREASFGRSLLLRCPYYQVEGGLCTIWRHRETVCSTFFCKYVAGQDGETFWKTLRVTMGQIENALCDWAVRTIAPHVGAPNVPLGNLTLEDLEDRPPNATAYSALWRDWEGREEEFYVRCHELVTGVSAAELEGMLGQAGAARLAVLEEAYRDATATALPERLVLNPEMQWQEVPEGVLVKAYSRYEPVLLTKDLYEVLREFGAGETVAEVRARLARDAGVEVPEPMLVSLYQLRVVVPPAPAAASADAPAPAR